MNVRSDTTLHLNGYWPAGLGQVFDYYGKRLASVQFHAEGQSVGALGEVPPLALIEATLRAAEGLARETTVDELHADPDARDRARKLAMKVLVALTDGVSPVRDGLGDLAETVKGERWPTVAEVAGEVYAPSCGQAGCSPAWPCQVCQSLAGTTGGER